MLQDRGDLIGDAKALERAQTAEKTEADTMPDAGAGFLDVVSLGGAPAEVLPRTAEAVGTVPPDTVVVITDPD